MYNKKKERLDLFYTYHTIYIFYSNIYYLLYIIKKLVISIQDQ